jgi:hypothetical protein
VVFLVFESVVDGGGLFTKDLFVGFSELDVAFAEFIEHFIKPESFLSFGPLDFEPFFSIAFEMVGIDEVFVEVDVIVAGSVENSFELFLVFFDLDHFETVVQEFILFNIIENILIERFEFSNDLVIDLFAFGNKLVACDFSKLELHFGFGSALFAGVENLRDFLSLFELVQQIVEVG